ncbi:hypothetical protein QJQ45_004067 [Haematococcus lacustris]|nr:hypothetical protein QJQ45_004067 [Haematococcus lacustris]
MGNYNRITDPGIDHGMVEQELPQTAALLRLSGLEVSGCVSELGGLGSELAAGLRSSALLAAQAQAGVSAGAAALGQAPGRLRPALAAGEAGTRRAVEAALQQRAKLPLALPIIIEAASSTTRSIRVLRLGLALANLCGATVRAGTALRGRAARLVQGSTPGDGHGAAPAALHRT